MHAFTTSDLGPRHGWSFTTIAVILLAWCGLITVCLAVVGIGAAVGYVLWRVATAWMGVEGW